MTQILVETAESAIRVIRFNRPEKKNAITTAMYHELTAALAAAAQDDAVRCIAFLGTPGCFSAGNDLADFLAFAEESPDEQPAAFAFLKALAGFEKPVVAGVDGLAIGIGLTLNLHCDLTIASDRSLFRTPFVDLGLVPEAASSLIAPGIMGHQRAFALLAMGEGMTAEEARAAGLVWRVVSPEAVETETLAAARKLAGRPIEALRATRALLKSDSAAIFARMEEEVALFTERLKSDEARAEFRRFLKR
ncbi:crotonase/enoyl-CoA hydratase family protein [Rhizobium sp. YJ-22]|uniref:crotonase/enoyl-CoA hydratase family protein n=1 Tax=Rhizobium sp. YJ-22 TaxID=3037556 RepID=UPI002412DB58|nr:crotonase/enoyl-CoA hydratase family protein [Rhizobium sp. YJ-22]MDG3575005.1 crotonase/enoyl-CoA hydratase family protein [Rhizobium sp. YJ-22]